MNEYLDLNNSINSPSVYFQYFWDFNEKKKTVSAIKLLTKNWFITNPGLWDVISNIGLLLTLVCSKEYKNQYHVQRF